MAAENQQNELDAKHQWAQFLPAPNDTQEALQSKRIALKKVLNDRLIKFARWSVEQDATRKKRQKLFHADSTIDAPSTKKAQNSPLDHAPAFRQPVNQQRRSTVATDFCTPQAHRIPAPGHIRQNNQLMHDPPSTIQTELFLSGHKGKQQVPMGQETEVRYRPLQLLQTTKGSNQSSTMQLSRRLAQRPASDTSTLPACRKDHTAGQGACDSPARSRDDEETPHPVQAVKRGMQLKDLLRRSKPPRQLPENEAASLGTGRPLPVAKLKQNAEVCPPKGMHKAQSDAKVTKQKLLKKGDSSSSTGGGEKEAPGSPVWKHRKKAAKRPAKQLQLLLHTLPPAPNPSLFRQPLQPVNQDHHGHAPNSHQERSPSPSQKQGREAMTPATIPDTPQSCERPEPVTEKIVPETPEDLLPPTRHRTTQTASRQANAKPPRTAQKGQDGGCKESQQRLVFEEQNLGDSQVVDLCSPKRDGPVRQHEASRDRSQDSLQIPPKQQQPQCRVSETEGDAKPVDETAMSQSLVHPLDETPDLSIPSEKSADLAPPTAEEAPSGRQEGVQPHPGEQLHQEALTAPGQQETTAKIPDGPSVPATDVSLLAPAAGTFPVVSNGRRVNQPATSAPATEERSASEPDQSTRWRNTEQQPAVSKDTRKQRIHSGKSTVAETENSCTRPCLQAIPENDCLGWTSREERTASNAAATDLKPDSGVLRKTQNVFQRWRTPARENKLDLAAFGTVIAETPPGIEDSAPCAEGVDYDSDGRSSDSMGPSSGDLAKHLSQVHEEAPDQPQRPQSSSRAEDRMVEGITASLGPPTVFGSTQQSPEHSQQQLGALLDCKSAVLSACTSVSSRLLALLLDWQPGKHKLLVLDVSGSSPCISTQTDISNSSDAQALGNQQLAFFSQDSRDHLLIVSNQGRLHKLASIGSNDWSPLSDVKMPLRVSVIIRSADDTAAYAGGDNGQLAELRFSQQKESLADPQWRSFHSAGPEWRGAPLVYLHQADPSHLFGLNSCGDVYIWHCISGLLSSLYSDTHLSITRAVHLRVPHIARSVGDASYLLAAQHRVSRCAPSTWLAGRLAGGRFDARPVKTPLDIQHASSAGRVLALATTSSIISLWNLEQESCLLETHALEGSTILLLDVSVGMSSKNKEEFGLTAVTCDGKILSIHQPVHNISQAAHA